MPKTRPPYAPEFQQQMVELVQGHGKPRLPPEPAADSPACGPPWDRSPTAAMCESFFATLECEPLDQHRCRSQAEAHVAVFEFIEGWYNPRQRHSAICRPLTTKRTSHPPRPSPTVHETGATPHSFGVNLKHLC